MACKENTSDCFPLPESSQTVDLHSPDDDGEKRCHRARESVGTDTSCQESTARTAEDVPENNIPEAVRRLRSLLVDRYVSATVDMGEGMVDEGLSEPSVSDVQVQLIILSRPELQQEFRNTSFDTAGDMWHVEHVFTKAADSLKNISLESLFNMSDKQKLEFTSGGRTYRILAVASAGCGKTFIFTKVGPLKWARNEIWNEFDLVVARQLRDEGVRKAKSICALLGVEELGEFTSDERKSIDDYVRQQAHRVCLVFDGLDEIRLNDCSGFVRDIINGSSVKGLRLVVTARPCTELLRLCDRKHFDRRVELIGFRKEDVDVYIRKVLGSAEEASALITAVHDDQNLASMMATPFLAMQTCKMFHCRNRTLPRCLSDIFEMMIVQVAERCMDESYEKWSEIPADVQALILQLGKLSFTMLCMKQLIFTNAELEKYSITREAKSLGLLVLADSTNRDKKRLWMFSHLTLQESLAARYVAVKKATTLARVVCLPKVLGSQSCHLRTFWMLLTAQLDKEKADCLISRLLKVTTSAESNQHSWKDVDGDIDEALDKVSENVFPLDMLEPLSSGLNYNEICRLAEELLFDQVRGQSGERYVENRCKYGRCASGEEFLRTMLLAWVERCPDAGPIMLTTALRRIGKQNLAELLERTPVTTAAAADPDFTPKEDIEEEHRRDLNLGVLCFAEHCHHNNTLDAMSSVAAALQRFDVPFLRKAPAIVRAYDVALAVHSTSVRTLGFTKTVHDRVSSECDMLESVLKCTNVTELVVFQAERVEEFWKGVVLCINASCLHITKITLGEGAAECIWVPSPSDHHTGRGKLVAEALSNLPCLQEFWIKREYSLFHGEEMKLICNALSGSSHLSVLWLSGKVLPACVGILAENLCTAWLEMKQIRIRAVFEGVPEILTEEDVSAFLHAVNTHASLQSLMLSAPDLSSHLRLLHSLSLNARSFEPESTPHESVLYSCRDRNIWPRLLSRESYRSSLSVQIDVLYF